MSPVDGKLDLACGCGATLYAISRYRFRIVCHCSICQRFNRADCGDTLVCRASDIVEPYADTVEFETYRSPPNIERGVCGRCGDPSVEVFKSMLLPNIVMVPYAVHKHCEGLEDPVGHLFYENRVRDLSDDLPKHNGYLLSQLAFGKHLVRSL